MELKVLLGTLAAVLALFSSYAYIKDIFKGNTKPHTYTWLIWTIVGTVAFLGQVVSGGGPGSWATGVSAIFSTIILILSFKYGTKDITKFDKVCLVLSLVSILPWAISQSVLWSVILATFIDMVAFFPTMRKTWHAPWSESLGSMWLDVVKHFSSVVSIRTYSLTTLIFPVSLLVIKFVIIGEIIFLRKFRKKVRY